MGATWVWLCLVGLLGGCVDGELPAESHLDRLRVLAARAVPAEAGPGDAVTLESLTYDPDQRSVGVVWELCASADCPSVELRSDPVSVLDSGTPDPEAGIVGLEPEAPPRVVIPPGLLDALDAADRTEGTFLRFGLTAVAWPDGEGDEFEWATKDLPVSASGAPNQNPVLSAIRLDGTVVRSGEPLVVDGEVALEVDQPDALAETYAFVTSEGIEETRTEDLSVSWYSDVGVLDGARWDVGQGGEGILIVVVRDGRGGTDWATFPIVGP